MAALGWTPPSLTDIGRGVLAHHSNELSGQGATAPAPLLPVQPPPVITQEIPAFSRPIAVGLKKEHEIYARASKEAYQLTNDARAKKLDTYDYVPDSSDLYTAVYHDKANKHTIMAHRGTKIGHAADLGTDAALFMGTEATNPRFMKVLGQYDSLVKKLGNNVTVTGHSLGGTLADHIVKNRGTYGITFNAGAVLPGGFGPSTGLLGWGDKRGVIAAADKLNLRHADKITSYRTNGDLVSLMNKRGVINIAAKKSGDPHDLGNFLA